MAPLLGSDGGELLKCIPTPMFMGYSMSRKSQEASTKMHQKPRFRTCWARLMSWDWGQWRRRCHGSSSAGRWLVLLSTNLCKWAILVLLVKYGKMSMDGYAVETRIFSSFFRLSWVVLALVSPDCLNSPPLHRGFYPKVVIGPNWPTSPVMRGPVHWPIPWQGYQFGSSWVDELG